MLVSHLYNGESYAVATGMGNATFLLSGNSHSHRRTLDNKIKTHCSIQAEMNMSKLMETFFTH